MLGYDKKLKPYARQLRSGMTDAELRLWGRLRAKQIHGVQFYRQKPLGPYIVDFYAAKPKLIIEIDGAQHFEPAHQARDSVRDAWLTQQGLRVLRFDNLQVLQETEAVLEQIWHVMKGRMGV
jgi:very-short-patch-repair endonuclease